MVAPLLAPDPRQDTTTGVPWSPSYTGPQYTTRTTGFVPSNQQGGMMWYPSQAFGELPSGAFPSNYSPDDIQRTIAGYDRYIATQQQAWQQASGLQRKQIEAQIENAKQALANAKQIAQLQAETSRYGVDQQRQTALDQLKENQRQFDVNHDVELRKLGLDYANTATQYLSTPDRYIEGATYLNLAGRVFAGQPGSTPGNAIGTPTPKTEQDFANLAAGGTGQYDSRLPQTGGGAAGGGFVNNGAMSPADVASRAAGAGGAGADTRIKALKSVIDAAPPSPDPGLNGNDQAVLAAARALYSTNLNPGQFQALKSNPTAYGINQSAGRRLGYDVNTWEADQRKNQLGFGSSRAA